MEKHFVEGRHVRFSTSYRTVLITSYSALKIEKIVNHKKLLTFGFL